MPPDATGELGHPDAAAWALGALDPGEAGRFKAHLQSCGGCRIAVADFEQVARALAHPPPAVEPPPDLQARTLASVQYAVMSARRARENPAPAPAPAKMHRWWHWHWNFPVFSVATALGAAAAAIMFVLVQVVQTAPGPGPDGHPAARSLGICRLGACDRCSHRVWLVDPPHREPPSAPRPGPVLRVLVRGAG